MKQRISRINGGASVNGGECLAPRRRYHDWLSWPGYILFFMMLFVPTAYQSIKGALLAMLLGMIVVIALWNGKLALHRVIFLWTLFMASMGLLFMLVGLANGAPGALRVGTVYVLWPIVYAVMVAGAANERVIEGLLRVLVLSALAIGLYSLSYVMNAAGWLPDQIYFALDQGQAIGFYGGFVEFRLYSLSSLLFLIPFLLGALFIWPKEEKMPVSRSFLWLATIVTLASALLSGRKAIWLVVAMAPAIAMFGRLFCARQHKLGSRKLVKRVFLGAGLAMVALVVFLKVVIEFDVLAMARQFATGFDFFGDASAVARREQFFALVRGWEGNPWFGAGHGASAPGLLRSVEQPWAYELSYIALLFHTGLIGVVVYGAAVAWIFWMGFKMIRSGGRWGLYMLPILVGTSCFLIGNATNPYLEKFDYMWVIFLPAALINVWLLRSGNEYPRNACVAARRKRRIT